MTGTQFTITGGTCVNGLFIGAGSSCTVTVTFNPSGAADTKTDTLNVSYNDGWVTRVATLGLSATATGGQQAQPAVLSIGAVSFPATTIGSTSSVVTATVTNTGGSAGVISSRTLTTGTNFAITGALVRQVLLWQ